MSTKASLSKKWPLNSAYRERFRVEDLIPQIALGHELTAVFIGESPHRDEVASENAAERSPFRGTAGREWWQELSQFQATSLPVKPVPDRMRLLQICSELQIGVMNAVQFPIDPKICLHQGNESDPYLYLGFEKSAGIKGYKAIFKQNIDINPVLNSLEDLRARLSVFDKMPVQLVCLGNDSRWFVEHALKGFEGSPLTQKPLLTIPHPSAWWRKAEFRSRSVALLNELLAQRPVQGNRRATA